MKFKVGDRVKFLNESGGGIISKIVSHGLVNVAIEDGFEIPTMVSNLILVEENTLSVTAVAATQPEAAQPGKTQAEPIDRSAPLLSRSGQKSLIPGLYLAFLPANQRWLLTGNMDLFILNHTGWDVMFSLFVALQDGTYVNKDFDIIPRNSRYHLATIKPDNLEKWSQGTLQFLFRRKKLSAVVMPASVNFKISGQRFRTESNYTENALLEGRNFLVSLMASPRGFETSQDLKESEPDIPQVEAKPLLPVEIIDTYRTRDEEAVVDLHIESLSEDHAHLKSHDILSVQKSTFKACLESALRSGYRKVTFIHGIGAGRLKQEIITILDGYKHIRVQDAPLSEFGQGALELFLPQNEVD